MADNVPASMIDARLADLREANEVFRKTDRDRSSEIHRNDREIRWLTDLRSILVADHAQAPQDSDDIDASGAPHSGIQRLPNRRPAPAEVYEDPYHFARLLRADAELSRHEWRDIANLLEQLAQEAADWRSCAKYGNTAEGRKPNGFRRAALEECRQKYIEGRRE